MLRALCRNFSAASIPLVSQSSSSRQYLIPPVPRSFSPRLLVYDPTGVHRNMVALGQVGIFDPLMMRLLTANRSSVEPARITI